MRSLWSACLTKIIAYTDGSASPNPGPGGWAALLIHPDGREEALTGASPATTNNVMELSAAIAALKAVPPGGEIEMVTDSEYLKNGITSWIKGWLKNGWKTAAGKPVLNRPLWETLHELNLARKVSWRWTKAHVGTHYNERVDQLANQARVSQRDRS